MANMSKTLNDAVTRDSVNFGDANRVEGGIPCDRGNTDSECLLPTPP